MLTGQDCFVSLLIQCHDTGNRMDLFIELVSSPAIYVSACGSNISPSCDKILGKKNLEGNICPIVQGTVHQEVEVPLTLLPER